MVGDYRRFGSSTLLLSSRSILNPLKLTNSLCQLSDVPVLDPSANAIFNNETRLITGLNIKYAPTAFCSVDKMNKRRQT